MKIVKVVHLFSTVVIVVLRWNAALSLWLSKQTGAAESPLAPSKPFISQRCTDNLLVNNFSENIQSCLSRQRNIADYQREFCSRKEDYESGSLVLLIDVDNTLYENKDTGSSVDTKIKDIESQVVRNIHSFCLDRFNLSKQQADDLHHRYGSTIEGLKHEYFPLTNSIKANKSSNLKHQQILQDFYHNVYHNISVAGLMCEKNKDSSSVVTGYSNDNFHSSNNLNLLKNVLASRRACFPKVSLYLTSNSPLCHVCKIVQAMGLTRIPWKGIWTPDSERTWSNLQLDMNANGHLGKVVDLDYPTKSNAAAFFDPAIIKHLTNERKNSAQQNVILLDDSYSVLQHVTHQLDVVQGIFLATNNAMAKNDNIHFSPILSALAVAMGWTLPSAAIVAIENKSSNHHQIDNDSTTLSTIYNFDQVRYLRHKNKVDMQSINIDTWKRLGLELAAMFSSSKPTSYLPANSKVKTPEKVAVDSMEETRTLSIVDIGAGLLSMLCLFINGADYLDLSSNNINNPNDLESHDKKKLPSLLSFLPKTIRRINYNAFEPNVELKGECLSILNELGFEQKTNRKIDENETANELLFVRHIGSVHITVNLRFSSFDKDDNDVASFNKSSELTPHLIVGCCFADLIEPVKLTQALLRRFFSTSYSSVDKISRHQPLIYFPITFCGVTQFLPPLPEEYDILIPSDTTAFRFYSKALTHQGHHLDPHHLINAIEDYGGSCLARGVSDWNIDPVINDYFYKSMMNFFGTIAAPYLHAAGWNARGWLRRARIERPKIHVTNIDLLFKLPHLGNWRPESVDTNSIESEEYQEIQFLAPSSVTSVRRFSRPLQPREIRIQSVASLVSTGTELKVFKGEFDDAALDVNIKGMAEERMAYPLTYGYSLVGRVVACGTAVQDAAQISNKLVFAFAPHASQAVVDRDAVQIIPDGIDALDAIFMPAVETALSLVQDANPRFGEKVIVFGQGLIGLLVTALLGRSSPPVEDCCASPNVLTTVETLPTRLAISTILGSSQAIYPLQVSNTGLFDVAIEISGNCRALQSAIDATREGGLVIIGSWYGNSGMNLKLGIDFHRSQKILRASQVSRIPAEQQVTWSKERRFEVAWNLVRELQPSRLISRKTNLENAQNAYESLADGRELAIIFEYR